MSPEYTYAAAYVKSLEANMLTNSDFTLSLEFSEEELADFLRSHGYVGDSLWEMLIKERERIWELCRDLCRGDEMLDVLMMDNDFHNIKAVIKSVLSKNDWKELIYEPSGIDCTQLEVAVKNNDFQYIDDFYGDICRKAFEIYKTDGGQAMEIFLDKKHYSTVLSRSRRDSFVYGWAERKALILNLKIFLRTEGASREFLEKALVENNLIDVFSLVNGSKSKEEILLEQGYQKEYDIWKNSPAKLEKYLDDMLTGYLKNAQTEFFSFAPVLGYFEGKKTEIINIRLIAYGRRSGMQKEKIAERLREAYV